MVSFAKRSTVAAVLLALFASSCANPEWVDVKYRSTPVHVGSPEFVQLDSNSSLVRDAWYDNANRYLVINLKGTNYHYCAFPRNVWNELRYAESQGDYYLSDIKSRYDCRRVGTIPSYN